MDVAANRKARKWTVRELLFRALWESVGQSLLRWSPRPLWSWRRMVLRLFGARIGANVHIHPTVRIAIPWHLDIADDAAVGEGAILYSLGRITIGRAATISQYAHLCAGTHDYRQPDMLLLKPPIGIGDDAWVCADAFIGPGVSVGVSAIVGARAVAIRDVPAGMIYAGNPARAVKPRAGEERS